MTMKRTKVISFILCLSLLVGSLACAFVSVSAKGLSEELQAAFSAYVAQVGNDFDPTEMTEQVSAKAGVSATLSEYFITHAVDGVYDENNEYPLSIPGHDGRVAAVLSVGDASYAVTASIPHEEENLGSLKTDVYAADSTVFTTDENGNITDYTGSAEKIVIPATFAGTISLKEAAGKNGVKVVWIGGDTATMAVTLGSECFAKWPSLRAMVLPYVIRGGSVGWRAVFNNPQLKYVRLPLAVQNSTGGYSTLGDGAFMSNPVLENAASKTGDMPSTRYQSSVFAGTAIRDYVLPEWMQDANQNAWNSPAYKKGVQTILYGPRVGATTNYTPSLVTKRNTATFTRALTLAAEKAEALRAGFTGEATAENIKTQIESAYTALTTAGGITVTADWNGTFAADAAGNVTGTLTLSDGTASADIAVSYRPQAGLSALAAEGKALTPAFDPDTLTYGVQLLDNVSSLTLRGQYIKGVTAVTGAAVTGYIARNGMLTVSLASLAEGDNPVTVSTVIPTGTVDYVINVIRLNREDPLREKLQAAFTAYTAQAGNDWEPDGMLAELTAAAGQEVTLEDRTKDYFITHAVDGVYDENDEYPLSVPGHDGYVTAVVKVGGNAYGLSAEIPHAEENLGALKTDVYSPDSAVFTTDENGNITDYTGSAEKIVIPATFTGTISLKEAAGKNGVKVVWIGGDDATMAVTLGSESFSKWQSLRAMVLPARIRGGSVGWRAVYSNPQLKYVRLPVSVQTSTGGYSMLDDGAFMDDPVLENAASKTGEMPSARYLSSVFAKTAIRDYVLPVWMQDAKQNAWNDPVYKKGVQTILYNINNGVAIGNNTNYAQSLLVDRATAGLARVAVLAAEKAEALRSGITGGVTAENIKAQIESAYAAQAAAGGITVTADWGDTFRVSSDGKAGGTLYLSSGSVVIPIAFSYDPTAGLEFLSLGDYALSPAFESGVTEYSVTVPFGVTSLKVTTRLAPGAVLQSLTGNTDLQVGDTNRITVTVQSPDQALHTYTVAVTREEKLEFDEIIRRLNEATEGLVCTDRTTRQDLEECLFEAVGGLGYTVSVKDWYLLPSISGATENGSTVLVPGHKGYMTAVLSVELGDETRLITLKKVIEPTMYDYTFASVSSPEDFELSADGKTLNTYWGNEDGGVAEKIVIPDGVEKISEIWFYNDNWSGVRCIVLPDSVKELPDDFANGMRNLQVVVMGDGVITCGTNAFTGCCYLRHVRLSENLQSISINMFRNTLSLCDLYFPASIKSVESNAFYRASLRRAYLVNTVKIEGTAFSYPVTRVTNFMDPSMGCQVSEEEAASIQEWVNRFLYTNGSTPAPRLITVPTLNVEATAGAFGTNTSGAWGYNALRYPAGSSLADLTSDPESTLGRLKDVMDLSLAGAAAHTQFVADHIRVPESVTAEQVLEMIGKVYCGETLEALTWATPFEKTEDGTVTGALRLQDGSGAEFTTEIETKTAYVYTPPTVDPEPTPDDPSSGGSASDDKPASDTSDTSKPADNPDTGSALPVAGAVAAILALGAVIVLRKKAE